MNQRVFGLALFVLLSACSAQSTVMPEDQPNGGTGATNNKTSTGSTSTTTGTTGSTASALDGTWDVTTSGEDAVAASQLTFSGGHVTGSIVFADEGQAAFETASSDGTTTVSCIYTKHRQAIDLKLDGDAFSGTVTLDTEYSPADCGDAESTTMQITATRKPLATAGTTPFEGDWTVGASSGSDDSVGFAVNIAGLIGKAWSSVSDESNAPVVTYSVANGAASTGAGGPGDLTFAARKR